MYTLLYVFTILSFTRHITTSQAIGLEALTPCFLTASDGVAVHAFCGETITPCTLRASDGALVQAYCEPSLVSEPFASITGTSALQNSTGKTSLLQILARSPDTVPVPSSQTPFAPSGISSGTSLLSPKTTMSPPVGTTAATAGIGSRSSLASTNREISVLSNPSSSITSKRLLPSTNTTSSPLTSLSLTKTTLTSQPSAQTSLTTALIASTALAADPYCLPDADPDFREGSFCTCSDGNQYAIATQGTTPASLFNPCPYTSGSVPQTTMAPNISNCEFDGPANCSTTSDLNIQSIINQAHATFVAEELSNCSTFTARAGYPGINGAAAGDSCIEYFNITSHMLWWWEENSEHCTNDLNVGFANCFYDLTWDGGSNCSNLAGDFYCKEPNITLFRQGENQTLDFYVAWNIYNFALWSFSYYTAMQYAYSYTTAFIWNDTLAFEQVKGPFPIGEEILMGVLTFALGILSPSGWGKELPGKGGANAIQNVVDGAKEEAQTASQLGAWILQKIFQPEVPGEYLLRAAQQTPGLVHTILVPLETGTIDAAIYTSTELTANLAKFALALSQIIQDVEIDVSNNVTAFAEWTSTGFFFVPALMTEQDMVTYITWGLNTYVISQILQNDNVLITRQLDTNPYDLQHNASHMNLSNPAIIGCSHGYNEWNQCGAFWWDEVNNVAYSLSSTSDLWNNYSSDLTTIFDQNLTTPELLFLGSQYCQDGYNATADESPFTNAASGLVGMTTACLSDLAVCTWNLANASGEFVEPWCNVPGYFEPDYDFPDCAADNVDVPIGYLGYYLYNGATCESEE